MPTPAPVLETIAQSLNYGDLPETWHVPDIEQFSQQKTLYDYQRNTLENAARALYLYYGEENAWQPTEPPEANSRRKQNFADRRYANQTAEFSIRQYDGNADRRNLKQNPVFKILAEYITPQSDIIPYHHLINRMCFWMATGSGKTLVMVKIIEYLHRLKQHQQIPPHNILILAPSNHLIGQIRRTIEEFNETGLSIDFVPLRDGGRTRQGRLGEVETVYYHRSDNISDVQKDALTDYRQYENGGEWYVLLDEAHKGGKEDSKRQAYYALMARAGFLFNFSATFTDPEDVVTTVKKYNLEEFVKNGYGKNIYLNESEYRDFTERSEEVSGEQKTTIVLKSLITLAYVSRRVAELRRETKQAALYQLPLMLTLVNSVNTDVKDNSNDLWVFFQVLRRIAEGDIDQALFNTAKNELLQDWQNARFLFGVDGGAIVGVEPAPVENMNVGDLREAVFLSRKQGKLQIIRGKESNKELAFQLVNADRPFAMFRIGDTAKWRNELLVGFEETTTLQEQGFFSGLEASDISILMGSRAFFESWDSKRPNVINFINIGGHEAKKFVVQAIGRGVRIEPLPGKRRRLAFLTLADRTALQNYHDQIGPPETLFLFATNRTAIKAVLEGIAAETSGAYARLTGFEKSAVPKVNGKEMPLLVPEYQEVRSSLVTQDKFAMSNKTLGRSRNWLDSTSDSVFIIRDNLTPQQIGHLRQTVETQNVNIKEDKHYVSLPFLQERLLAHLSVKAQAAKGMRKLEDQDIVHFRCIRVHSGHVKELQPKINQVKQGWPSSDEIVEMTEKLKKGIITRGEFDKRIAGKDEESFKGLRIKKLVNHYYFPVVLGSEAVTYIQHIIKTESEVNFVEALEQWLQNNEPPDWDGWMFSKIDEALDDVHIPYYDNDKNDYRRFLPDFVFWMCKGNEYRIVFVDPKGMAYASVYSKIDGYSKLFRENGQCRVFRTKTRPALKVSVELVLFNPKADEQPAEQYARYWHDNPAAIFA